MMPENTSKEDVAVREFFTATATDYSDFFSPKPTGSNFIFRERLALAVEMTREISGRFFDCACGSGEITAAILSSKRFPNATIVDLSPRMLEIAKKQIEEHFKISETSRLQFVTSDIFAFDAQSAGGKYDLILCLGLIAHTGRLRELLTKLRGMLAPNGRILLQSSLLEHLGNRIARAITEERYHRKYGYRISYFGKKDIELAVADAGLSIVSMQRYSFGFPLGDRLFARVNYHLENKLAGWSKKNGAEALYLLRNSTSE